MLMKLNSEGKTVIIFTKDEELSKQFGKRMITLDFGEVVSDLPNTLENTEDTKMESEEALEISAEAVDPISQ
jgi:energy-coupling factor transporter ATP-binding protein EcfA2